MWVDVAAAALETRGRICCLCYRGRRGSGEKDQVTGLHLLSRARSCSTLAGTKHLTGPWLILYIPVARPDLQSVTLLWDWYCRLLAPSRQEVGRWNFLTIIEENLAQSPTAIGLKINIPGCDSKKWQNLAVL